jgi:BirA family biotin operon repressor/biotin-[acetyl-CoA-carboxylase] ligase
MQETLFIGKNVINLPEINSTNDYLKEKSHKENIVEGTLVYTTYQNAGRGQSGNVWEMPPNQNLAMSYLLKPVFLSPEKQFYLNIAVSLAVREFCEKFCKHEVLIKWPNDILINNKKVAGILIENTIQGSKIMQSIVGIGININQEKFDKKIPYASSLKLESDNKAFLFDLHAIIHDMSSYLEKYYMQLRVGNFNFLTKAYTTSMWRYHQTQDFMKGENTLRGEIVGIAKDGRIEIYVSGKTQRYQLQEIKFSLEK